MGTKTRATLFAVAGILLAGAVNPLAAAVTVSGFVPFSSLDNGPLDEDPTVGVFAVSDTLVIDGTIDCSDAPPLPAHAGGCAVTLVTGGDLILEAGGAIVTENTRGGGNGGDVTLEAAGDVVLHGPAPALSGARISTARTTAANPGFQHAGAIDIEAGGDVVLVSGSTVSAAAAGGAAGAIEIVAGGGVQLHGLVASGPTEILDADPLTGEVLVPATAQQRGGPITVLSASTSGGSGVVVGATGVVVSQGDQQDAGLVLLEGCGIEVRGLVASLTREDGAAAVKLRSGEGLMVDGTDLGLPLDAPAFQGRLGAVRAGGSRGGSPTQRADLFARTDVQVLGPAPGQSASFAVSAAPGTKPHSSGGAVTVLSLEGGLVATGNAFEAGRSLTGNDGGAIDLQAAGDVVLDTAVVSAVGNFGSGAPGTGGDLVVQSYQGDVVWTGGTGDVRPVGGGVPASRRGSISLFYCGAIDLTGTAFPTVGPAVPPFPEVFQDCSLPGPELPPGDSLPVCNQPPVAADDDFTTDEDTAVAGNVLADNGHGADFDPGGDPLTVTEVNGSSADVGNLVVLPSGALLTLNADGTFNYDPNGQFEELAPGDEATDTFDYTVEEPGGLSDSATVTVTITGVDDDPVAVDDAATVAEDSGATTIDVLANDTDVDGGPISIQSVTQPANGTVLITNGGADLTYEPPPDYCNDGDPTDDFTYTLNGGSTATVSVTVTCADDDPVAVDDAAIVAEDSAPTAIDVLANDTDADGGPKSIQSVTQPANGTVVITNGGADLTYQPAPDYCNDGSPTDDFTYTLNGGSTATVSVTVTCVDDAPVAVNDAATVAEDSAATTIDVLANDTDADGGPKSIQSVTQPANGTVVITNGGADLTYQPAANYCNDGSPTDDFTYTLNGGSTATVSVTVTCVNDPPVAADDAFDFLGNTELRVDSGTVATPHALETTGSGFGVLDNDADPVEGDELTITSLTVGPCTDGTGPTFDCTDPAVGTVHMLPDGSFSFEPAAGDTGGTETFSYTASDDGIPPASASGTVTLTRFERVWYVDPNAASGGDGTSTLPFDSLGPLDGPGGAGDSDVAGDYVFVHAGTLNLAFPIEMEASQHLVGEGVGLSIPVSLNGNGSPTVLVAAGAHPELTNTTGSAVTVTEAVPVEVVGLRLEAWLDAIDVTTDAALAGSGTLTLGNNVIRGAGAEGIDVNLATGTTGTLGLVIAGNTWDVTGTHAGNAVDVARTAGVLNLALTGNTGIASSANAVVIAGGSVSNTTITALSGNTVHQDTIGSGFVVSNVTFDANPGGPYDQVPGGNTIVGISGNGVGGSALVLTNVAGDLAFTDLDLFADGGTGLGILGTGAVNVGAGTGTRVTVGAGVGIIEATGGPAVDLSNLTADLQLSSLKSTNTTTKGVSLSGVSDGGGTNAVFTAGSGSSITTTAGATGPVFNVSGGNAKITYAGTINNTGNSRAVSIDGWAGDDAGDDILFSGAITESGSGILVNGNGGARSITFSGGLTINTTTGQGFAATSNTNTGGLHITGTNTINSTSATALRVTSTPIGSSGLTFRSISSGNSTAAAEPSNGIVLSNTGSSGGLTVTGNGGSCTEGSSTCTGGWIQNIIGGDDSGATPVGTGIVLNNTSSVSLTRMRINDTSNYGIRGTSVNGFTFTNGIIDGANGTNVNTPFNDGSMVFHGVTGTSSGMTGTSSITNSTIMGGRQRNIAIDNSVGTLNLTVSGNTIKRTSDAAGDDGFHLEADTTANVTVAITNNTFARHGGDHINLSLLNSPVVDATITGNVLHGNYAGTPEGNHPIGLGQGIFILGATFNGTFTYEVSNNGTVAVPFRGNRQGGAIHVNKGSGTGTFSGSIENNVIGDPAIPGSGSSEAFGIIVGARGAGGSHTTLINNNQVREYFDRGILLEAGEGSAALNATVTNNTVSDFADAINSLHGIHSDNGILVGDTNAVCLHVSGNSVATAGNEAAGGADIRLRRGSSTTVRLPGLVGTDNTAATNHLQANNPTATSITVTGSTFAGGAACPQP